MTHTAILPLGSWCHTTTKSVQVSTQGCMSWQSPSASGPAKVHVRPSFLLSKESLQKLVFYLWILCITYTTRAVHRRALLLQYFCCKALRAGAALKLISPRELPPQKCHALERWMEETHQNKGFWRNATCSSALFCSKEGCLCAEGKITM